MIADCGIQTEAEMELRNQEPKKSAMLHGFLASEFINV